MAPPIKYNSILLNAFLFVILIVKIALLAVIVLSIYEDYKGNKDKQKILKNQKDKLHHIFTLLMGVLLIILFNPISKDNCVTDESKVFLFVFGILSILGVLKYFYDESILVI